MKVAGQLSGHPDRFSATVTLSWAPDQLENSSQWVYTQHNDDGGQERPGDPVWGICRHNCQVRDRTPNFLVCQKPASACVGRPKASNYFVYSQVGSQPLLFIMELMLLLQHFSGSFESEEAVARLVTVPTDLARVGADLLMNFVLALPFIVGSLIVKYWIYLLFP